MNKAKIVVPKKQEKEEEDPDKSHTGLTPVATTESAESELGMNSSDSDFYLDEEVEDDYRDAAYWQLPENVRHAIDISKRKKSKHSDFFCRLRSLNDKIGVYKKTFYTRTPKFE